MPIFEPLMIFFISSMTIYTLITSFGDKYYSMFFWLGLSVLIMSFFINSDHTWFYAAMVFSISFSNVEKSRIFGLPHQKLRLILTTTILLAWVVAWNTDSDSYQLIGRLLVLGLIILNFWQKRSEKPDSTP